MPRPRTPAEAAAAVPGATVQPAVDTIPSYMIQPGQTPKQVEMRRRMAQSLMEQGTSTAPLQGGGWIEAAARPLTAFIAGAGEYGAAQEEKRGQRSAAQALSEALTGDKIQPQQLGNFFGNEWATPGQQSVMASMYENQQKLANQEHWRPATQEEYARYNTEPSKGGLLINDTTGEAKVLGGGGVNIDMGDSTDKEFGKVLAKGYGDIIEQGAAAGETKAGVQQLRELLKTSPGGVLTGINVTMAPYLPEALRAPGTNDAVAAQAVISGMIPKQRVPGSGTTSDYDAKQFAASLPSMWNQPGANAIILDSMEAYADYRSAQADIITDIMSNPDVANKPKAIRDAMKALPDPFARWKEYRKASGAPSKPDTTAKPEATKPTVKQYNPETGKLEDVPQ